MAWHQHALIASCQSLTTATRKDKLMSRSPLSTRNDYRHWVTLQTRWSDNDAYGHVNKTIHYQWFDTVVNEWLVKNGLLDIEHSDPIGLVVETGCRYSASLSFPQAVEVGLAVDRIGTSSVKYRLGVFAKDSPEPAAEGHFVHVYVGRESRRPVPLAERWRTLLATIS
jgi:acyl-CoA thioester hydrolase